MYKISIVNYYNTTPFLFAINNSELKNEFELELDIPSVCANKLKNNLVDIGLVPVAILPELTNYNIITDYCIGAEGKVASVKLYSQKPLHELTHILLDYQSKTSITLVQVLNKFFWKKNIQFIDAAPGFENEIKNTTGAVIIGDRTFTLPKYPYEIDLADEWLKQTQLPFVFAAWVSNKEIDPIFISKFNAVLNFGVNHIQEAVYNNPKNIDGFDAYDYLKNKISYNLTERKKLGMAKFLEFTKQLNK